MKCCNRCTCICWRAISSSYVAIGVFTAVTSLVQILLEVAIFTGAVESSAGDQYNLFNTTGTDQLNREQTFYVLYIVLAAADLLVVLTSIILLFGIEAVKKSKWYYIPWCVMMLPYMLYESIINIYFFVVAFNTRNSDPTKIFIVSSYGFIIIPLIYWAVKEIFNVVGWVVVIANMQEMTSTRHQNSMVPLQEDNHSMTSLSVGGYQPKSMVSSVAVTQYPELQRAARAPTSFYQARYQPTSNVAAAGRRYNEYGGAARNTLYYRSDAY